MTILDPTGINTKRSLVRNSDALQPLSNASTRAGARLQLLLEHDRRARPNPASQDEVSLSRVPDEFVHRAMFPRVPRATVGGGWRGAHAGQQGERPERPEVGLDVNRLTVVTLFVP